MSDNKPARGVSELKHIKELGQVRAKAIKVALKLQAHSDKIRFKALEKESAENKAQIADLRGTISGISIALGVLGTVIALLIGVVGLWLTYRGK